MDIATILSIITAISTSTFASLAVYKHWTRPRLKITGYRKEESGDIIIFYVKVTRKGKKVAKGCEAKIQVNNYRYNGRWMGSWSEKQNIHTSDEFQLFSIDKVHETISFPTLIPEDVNQPIGDYRDKNLEIVVTSENAESGSDKKTISEICDKASLKLP